MAKLFCVMGKSASGKDTIFKALVEDPDLDLHVVVPYTTRPIRAGESDGGEYFFVTEAYLEDAKKAGKVIEHRAYQTVHGIWNYFIADDGQINLNRKNSIVIGTLESYQQIRNYFGADQVVPIYIEVEDGIRLSRALHRERQQSEPKYAEMCRRFLADGDDFSETNIKRCNIGKRYNNEDFDKCLSEVKDDILRYIHND